MKTATLLPAILLLTSAAHAESGEEWDGGFGLNAQRRSGFAVGADFGLGLGRTDGYPKDAIKLNDPRYEADTGLALGGIGRAWLGGAITDWFAFGLGVEMLRVKGDGLASSGTGFFLRPEIYPLWSLGGRLRDLGAYADFGLAGMKTKRGSASVADGGSLGLVGFGVFHESLRWRNLAIGPTLGCSLYFSDTMTATIAQLGLRVALTSGP